MALAVLLAGELVVIHLSETSSLRRAAESWQLLQPRGEANNSSPLRFNKLIGEGEALRSIRAAMVGQTHPVAAGLALTQQLVLDIRVVRVIWRTWSPMFRPQCLLRVAEERRVQLAEG